VSCSHHIYRLQVLNTDSFSVYTDLNAPIPELHVIFPICLYTFQSATVRMLVPAVEEVQRKVVPRTPWADSEDQALPDTTLKMIKKVAITYQGDNMQHMSLYTYVTTSKPYLHMDACL
jgi:hypothetical protein